MLYEQHLRASELGRVNVESDLPWDEIDVTAARTQPALLDELRAAALIESYHPVHVARVLQAVWDDVDACAVLSIELFEGFRHFHGLRKYLERVGHTPAITEEELVALRERAPSGGEQAAEPIQLLVDFMGSEHFAGYFFTRIAGQAADPFLRRLCETFAREEFRHAQGIGDVLRQRVEREPTVRDAVLAAVLHFTHYGTEAVDRVPIGQEHDLAAIMAFNRRVQRVCGRSPVEYLRAGQPVTQEVS
jgi:hypothetical protein